ncbi:MAG TPA: hypothetical protein VJ783_14405 [Pirellulales bacterium]|nr:hypothetical protein [Pirellulales bacterium]
MLSAGTLDPTFGVGGKVVTDFGSGELAHAVVTQPWDDKIVVAGETGAGGGGFNFALARYNPDGTLDTTFSFDGKAITDFSGGDDGANAVAIQNDGKIVAAGYATVSGIPQLALARYNSDGTLDLGFGSNGKVATPINPVGGSIDNPNGFNVARAISVTATGDILVAGDSAGNMALLAEYTSNGSLDPSFGIGGTLSIPFVNANDLAIQSNGDIVVVGDSDVGSGNELALSRFDPHGNADPTFGTSGQVLMHVVPGDTDEATSVALQTDGRMVVAGYSTSPGMIAGVLARFLPDGTPDSDFDADGRVILPANDPLLKDVAVQTDGRIVAVGHDSDATHFTAVRCNPDGSLDSTFGNGGITVTSFGAPHVGATAMTLQADGKIVAAGVTDLLGAGTGDFAVARYNAAFSTIDLSKIGNLLKIIGTEADDDIAVTEDASSVTVASLRERTAPLTIPGIDQVDVETGDGNDRLSLNLQPASDQDFHLVADLGSGDDTLNAVLVSPGPCRPGEVPGSLGLAARGGAGNDTFNTVFVQPGPCMPAQVSLDGGAGDDRITTAFLGSDAPSSDDDPPSPVNLNVQGGDGRDDIRVIFGFNPQPDPPAMPSVFLNTPVQARLDGGRGDDDIRVIYGFNPQPDPPAKLFVNAPMDIAATGGQGDDDIRVIYGFNPQPDPPAIPSAGDFAAVPAVQINAPVTMNVDGGAGDDNIGFNAVWDVNAGGSTEVNLRGGLGSDRMQGGWSNHIAAGATSSVNMNGGSGDDLLRFDYVDAIVDGTLDVALDGGDGSDVITNNLLDPMVNAGGRVTLRADGGSGDDVLRGDIQPCVMPAGIMDVVLDGGTGDDTVLGFLDGDNEIAGALSMRLIGGAGNDTLGGKIEPCIEPAGVMNLLVDGGAGDDTMVGVLMPEVQRGGVFSTVFDGGAGNDRVAVTVAASGDGADEVTVEGGRGDDDLALFVNGDAMVDALIDGGPGIDVGRHTANVRVVNCER